MKTRLELMPLAVLASVAMSLGGCNKVSPTPTAPATVPSTPVPSAPTPVPITTTKLSVRGADGPLVTGETIQLTVTATRSDGSDVDVTSKVVWRSGNPAVASVSAAGLLQTLGVGNADLVASYDALTTTVTVTAGYDLGGVIHESDPFAHLPIANAQVEVIGGPLAGQSTITDSTGHFALRGVTDSGFALGFSKPGYEFLLRDRRSPARCPSQRGPAADRKNVRVATADPSNKVL